MIGLALDPLGILLDYFLIFLKILYFVIEIINKVLKYFGFHASLDNIQPLDDFQPLKGFDFKFVIGLLFMLVNKWDNNFEWNNIWKAAELAYIFYNNYISIYELLVELF